MRKDQSIVALQCSVRLLLEIFGKIVKQNSFLRILQVFCYKKSSRKLNLWYSVMNRTLYLQITEYFQCHILFYISVQQIQRV